MRPETYFFIAHLLKIVIIVLSVLAAGIFFLACVYIPIREGRRRKRKFNQLYSSREALDDQQFYERFFQSRGISKDVVVRIRRILAEELSLDMSRIIPEDDLNGNLAFIWGDWGGLDGLVAVEIVQRFEEEFGITITDAEAAAMKTVEDIVIRIWWRILNEPGKTFRLA